MFPDGQLGATAYVVNNSHRSKIYYVTVIPGEQEEAGSDNGEVDMFLLIDGPNICFPKCGFLLTYI